METAEKFFNKHGVTATLIGRLVTAVRQLIYIPAGLAKMNIAKFIAFTALGAGVWNAVLAALGWYLEDIVPEDQLSIAIGKSGQNVRLASKLAGFDIDIEADKTAQAQTEALSFEFDLRHSPEKVWRALTDPTLLAEWLLPVVDLNLEPGAVFAFKTQPFPDWDGT